MSNPFFEHKLNINRRHFLGKLGLGVGGAALGTLMVPDLFKNSMGGDGMPLGLKHYASKAKTNYIFIPKWSPFPTGELRLQTTSE